MTIKATVIPRMPKAVREATVGMHPETKRILQQLKTTKGNVLVCKLKSPYGAKIRTDALRRAKKRGTAKFKEARRQGATVYFRLR